MYTLFGGITAFNKHNIFYYAHIGEREGRFGAEEEVY